ncbi:MAG: HEAT repeat domain-containing protein [Verrucomicrobia bacterium]|nr:HEAT repeat domain-containing protein [Verrucomicrobiota bacterium]
MKTTDVPLATRTVVAAATAALAAPASSAASPAVAELIANLKSPDDKVRGPAWQHAGPSGAPAVKPLSEVMTDPDFEIARAARRALWKIVRHAGRPNAAAEAQAVATQLIALLPTAPTAVRRELLWMLSEIGGDDAVPPVATLLANADVREDARCALERIPGAKAVAALKQAMATAPEEFKYALAHSLRVRGETVAGYPSQKLVPTKPTRVTAVPGS